jgi:hypothetical protein
MIYRCLHTTLLSVSHFDVILRFCERAWEAALRKPERFIFVLYIVMHLEVCVIYRRVLDWWPDLLHTYTIWYYTSQTTIWHITSFLLHHIRLPSPVTPSVLFSAAWDPRYTALTESTVSNTTHIVVCLPIRRLEMGCSIVACMFISTVTCSSSRWLAMNYSGF